MNLQYIHTQTTFEKNGKRFRRITREIDMMKPKCWVEGHEYKFNSKIISMEDVDTDHEPIRGAENMCS